MQVGGSGGRSPPGKQGGFGGAARPPQRRALLPTGGDFLPTGGEGHLPGKL